MFFPSKVWDPLHISSSPPAPILFHYFKGTSPTHVHATIKSYHVTSEECLSIRDIYNANEKTNSFWLYFNVFHPQVSLQACFCTSRIMWCQRKHSKFPSRKKTFWNNFSDFAEKAFPCMCVQVSCNELALRCNSYSPWIPKEPLFYTSGYLIKYQFHLPSLKKFYNCCYFSTYTKDRLFFRPSLTPLYATLLLTTISNIIRLNVQPVWYKRNWNCFSNPSMQHHTNMSHVSSPYSPLDSLRIYLTTCSIQAAIWSQNSSEFIYQFGCLASRLSLNVVILSPIHQNIIFIVNPSLLSLLLYS